MFKSFHRQHYFFYVAITLVALSIAIGMIIWQERGQRELADRVGIEQLISLQSDKIRHEIAQLQLYLAHRIPQDDDDGTSGTLSGGETLDFRLNPSVSIFRIRSHFDAITELLHESAHPAKLSRKLATQYDRLPEIASALDSENPETISDIRLQLQGMALSMEQLEGLHNLRLKEFSSQLENRIQRDTRILIGFMFLLALVSLFITRWVSRLIASSQEKLTDELEDKNAELERFVYTVSHDLRTPLISIKGFVGLLQKDIATNDIRQIRDDIERIDQAADDMGELLEGLLELSRVGRIINPPELGSLDSLVHRAVEPVQDLIRERGITLDIEENMPPCWGDQLRLMEVFQNLVENAIKFMGNQPAPRIEVRARLEDEFVLCSVKDNGIGIEPRYHERVFDLFERLDPSIEGSGIGMTLVKRIVEAHGGRIRIKSIGRNQGCTFYFTLPLKPEEETP